MFVFDVATGRITMHSGDTGSVIYNVGGATLGSDDRVLWTMKNGRGEIVKQEILTADNSNNVTVEFANSDTDSLPSGTYQYDLRVVINPEYGTGDASGTIIDGDDVSTLSDPMQVIIKATVGHI